MTFRAGKQCPSGCGELNFLFHEVDIGVGTMTKAAGGECPICGQQFSLCSECEAWEWEQHQEWCSSNLRGG